VTVDATAHGDTGDTGDTRETPDGAPAGGPPDSIVLIVAPRPGELTPGWRLLTAVAWLAVAVAQGAVWKTSDQLGMSTWWLGPRGAPRPVAVQLMPFLPAVVMVLAAANRVRFLAWWGVVCAALVAAVGVADLGVMDELGWVEIAIGAAALLVSLASFTGSYRQAPAAA
jgi:hypothetical protein